VKPRKVVLLIALFAIGVFFVGRAYSDDKKMSEQEAAWAEWAKYATPDEHHKALDPFVGSWDVKTVMWMEPTSPALESKGTCEAKWILGGRYLQEEFTGDMNGSPFHGMGISGFDRVKNEYFSFWMDEMSTGAMTMTGQMDASAKVLTASGSYPDVTKNMKECNMRMVTRIVSNDQHVSEMYATGDDGKEYKNMELTYTRKKQM